MPTNHLLLSLLNQPAVRGRVSASLLGIPPPVIALATHFMHACMRALLLLGLAFEGVLCHVMKEGLTIMPCADRGADWRTRMLASPGFNSCRVSQCHGSGIAQFASLWLYDSSMTHLDPREQQIFLCVPFAAAFGHGRPPAARSRMADINGILLLAWKRYLDSLEARPLKTKVSCSLSTLSYEAHLACI